MVKRSHRLEKMAAVYDEEILPLWGQRFARLFLPELALPSKATVLDVGCTSGYEALEILRRHEDCRVIAIDPSGPLLELARRKAGEHTHRRIFFRTEPLRERLLFADDVFDLVFSNVRLLEFPMPAKIVSEFARACKVGGAVIVTLPLAGTWREFYDIYREVLVKHEKTEVLRRLEEHIARLPEPEVVTGWMEAAGLQPVELETEEFELLFKSSREFFFAPVIEFGPLSGWKEVAGKGEEMQQIFWHIKEAIDTYFGTRAFHITVKAACVRGTKVEMIPDVTTPLLEEDEIEEVDANQGTKTDSSPAPDRPKNFFEPEEPEEGEQG